MRPDDPDLQGAPALEDVLTALQKSFSRLGARTAARMNVAEKESLARLTGPLQYDMKITLRPEQVSGSARPPREPDTILRFDEQGPITLGLQGEIALDVRVHEVGPEDSDSENRGERDGE